MTVPAPPGGARLARRVTVPDRPPLARHVRGLIEAARNAGLSDPEIHDLARRHR